jgi:hypothetical protein
VNAMQDYYLPGVLAEELLVAADFGDALRVKALIEKGAATLPDQLRCALVPRSPSCVSRCRCDSARRLERLYGATSRRELGTRRAAPSPALVSCAGRSRQRSGRRRPDAAPPRCAGTCHARRDARTDRLACHCRVRTTCVCTTCMMHRAAPVSAWCSVASWRRCGCCSSTGPPPTPGTTRASRRSPWLALLAGAPPCSCSTPAQISRRPRAPG